MTPVRDYARWHHLMISTRDIDPHYDVLRHIDRALGPEYGAWTVLRMAAYYHLGSALKSAEMDPGPRLPEAALTLPTSTSRRNHRTPDQLRKHWKHLRASVEQHGGPRAWLTPDRDGKAGWNQMFDRAASIHGNGRYFAYKVAELSQKVIGTPIVAPDAGHAHSTGPRQGLSYLQKVPSGNRAGDIAALNRITEGLARRIGEPDIAQVETSLCAWQAVMKGRCYMGMYVDEQLEELNAMPSELAGLAWEARRASIPPQYLGEVNGWSKPQRERSRVYRDTGEILER